MTECAYCGKQIPVGEVHFVFCEPVCDDCKIKEQIAEDILDEYYI